MTIERHPKVTTLALHVYPVCTPQSQSLFSGTDGDDCSKNGKNAAEAMSLRKEGKSLLECMLVTSFILRFRLASNLTIQVP